MKKKQNTNRNRAHSQFDHSTNNSNKKREKFIQISFMRLIVFFVDALCRFKKTGFLTKQNELSNAITHMLHIFIREYALLLN